MYSRTFSTRFLKCAILILMTGAPATPTSPGILYPLSNLIRLTLGDLLTLGQVMFLTAAVETDALRVFISTLAFWIRRIGRPFLRLVATMVREGLAGGAGGCIYKGSSVVK